MRYTEWICYACTHNCAIRVKGNADSLIAPTCGCIFNSDIGAIWKRFERVVIIK